MVQELIKLSKQSNCDRLITTYLGKKKRLII